MTERNKKFLDAMDALIADYEQEGGVTIGMSLQVSNHVGDAIDHYRWNGEIEFVATTDSFEDIELTKLKNRLTIVGADQQEVGSTTGR